MPETNQYKTQSEHRNTFFEIEDKSEDFTLPEYYDDMVKILDVSARAKTNGKYVGAKNADADGEVLYSVTFMNSMNKIRNVLYSTSIEHSCEIGGISDASDVNVSLSVISCTHRMLSPRKINLKSKIGCEVSYTSKHENELEICGKHSPADERSIEKKFESAECSSFANYEDNGVSFAESFETEKQICDTVFCNMYSEPCDISASEGKAYIECSVFFEGMFETTDGKYECRTHRFKINHEMEAPKITSSSKCFVCMELKDLKIGISDSADGSNKFIDIEFSYDFSLLASNKEKITFCRDAYSTAYHDELKYENAETMCTSSINRCSYSFSTSKEKSELGISGDIICVCARPYIEKVEYDSEKGKNIASGRNCYRVIFCDENVYSAVEFKDNFRYELPTSECSGKRECFFYCTLGNNEFHCDSTKLYCDSEIVIHCHELCLTEYEAVSSIELHTESEVENSMHGMKIYYPSNGEKAWDISKKYRVPCDELKNANRITDDCEDCGKIVIIPPYEHGAKAVYSKII